MVHRGEHEAETGFPGATADCFRIGFDIDAKCGKRVCSAGARGQGAIAGTVSPRTRKAIRKPPICEGVA
jgi:hypothetical protein